MKLIEGKHTMKAKKKIKAVEMWETKSYKFVKIDGVVYVRVEEILKNMREVKEILNRKID